MKTVTYPELQAGNIVHFYGARFEITDTRTVPQDADHLAQFGDCGPTMCANGKWLDGHVQNGYFGPGKDWKFQGNKHATAWIEA